MTIMLPWDYDFLKTSLNVICARFELEPPDGLPSIGPMAEIRKVDDEEMYYWSIYGQEFNSGLCLTIVEAKQQVDELLQNLYGAKLLGERHCVMI